MARTLEEYTHMYWEFQEKNADPRVANFLFMDSPVPTLVICASYIYFCKVLGPKLMRDRKPVQLGIILPIYNLFQVALSVVLFSEIARYVWLFYISKITEFVDSLFFVLMKKNSHLSVLHIVHHSTMPVSAWLGCKFAPGGHTLFIGLANAFVHIWMYSYYFFSALGPQYKKYLWWKKYLTGMQLVQFILVFLHNFQLYFRSCEYPVYLVNTYMAHAVLFFVLFSNFFVQTYLKAQNRKNNSNGRVKRENGHAEALQDRNDVRKRNVKFVPEEDKCNRRTGH